MEFPRTTYKVIFTKKQAIEELKKINMVKKITAHDDIIEIYTKSIKLKRGYMDKYYKHSIGKYKITLIISVEENNILKYNISMIKQHPDLRKYTSYIHPHIAPRYFDGDICWGNYQSNIEKMKLYKDWYWLGKSILDLLTEELHENSGYREFEICSVLFLQYFYAELHNYKYISKIKKLMIEYDNTHYALYGNYFFNKLIHHTTDV